MAYQEDVKNMKNHVSSHYLAYHLNYVMLSIYICMCVCVVLELQHIQAARILYLLSNSCEEKLNIKLIF